MTSEQFFKEYANLPMEERFKIVNFNQTGSMTINDYYKQIKRYEEELRPIKIRQQKLINRYLNSKIQNEA
jgi:hypothetical protein